MCAERGRGVSLSLASALPLVAFLEASPWVRPHVRRHAEACLLDAPAPLVAESAHDAILTGGSGTAERLLYRGMPAEQHRLNLDDDPALEVLGVVDVWACLAGDMYLLIALDDDGTLLGAVEVAGNRGVRLWFDGQLRAEERWLSPFGVDATVVTYDHRLRPRPL